MTAQRSLDDELAKLNEMARRELVRYPEPGGCPPGGVWVRTATLDDDHQAHPEGPWHFGMGWNGSIGSYAVRCRQRRTRVNYALDSMLRPGLVADDPHHQHVRGAAGVRCLPALHALSGS